MLSGILPLHVRGDPVILAPFWSFPWKSSSQSRENHTDRCHFSFNNDIRKSSIAKLPRISPGLCTWVINRSMNGSSSHKVYSKSMIILLSFATLLGMKPWRGRAWYLQEKGSVQWINPHNIFLLIDLRAKDNLIWPTISLTAEPPNPWPWWHSRSAE